LRLIFASYYFGVGVVGLALGDRAKDLALAPTTFQRALSETGFMDPLLCLACLVGGGAMFFRRTTPLGVVILAPIVTVIFLFHLMITNSGAWGTLNLAWLLALAWQCRRGLQPLWTYTETSSV
jgi:hypothetical protein